MIFPQKSKRKEMMWEGRIWMLVSMFLISITLVVIYKYLWLLATPLVIGFFLAGLLEPLIQRISINPQWSRKLVTRLLFIFLFIVLGLIFFYLLINILKNIEWIMHWFKLNQDILHMYMQKIIKIMNLKHGLHLSQFDNLIEGIFGCIVETFQNIIASIPQLCLVVILSILTTFFLLDDQEKIISYFTSFLPSQLYTKIKHIIEEINRHLLGFFRVQLILGCSSFLYTWMVLWLLNIPNNLFLGFVAGILDIIPLFGPSLIFILSILYLMLMGNWWGSISLFIFLIILLVIRQIFEPKLLGDSMGYHPLIVLIVLYVCLKIYGLAGFIFTPLLLITLRAIYKGIFTFV